MRYWSARLLFFLGLALFVLIAEALWWTQQQSQSVYDYDSEKISVISDKLPYSMAWQKLQWQYGGLLGLTKRPKLIKIPAGSFEMGSTENYDTKPIHTVTLKEFWMSQTEITFNQYDEYRYQINLQQPQQTPLFPSDEQWGRGNRPVINVSWHEAQAYANWLSSTTGQQCRLPSEAEWEYAARAGTATKYPWGDDIGKNNANCDGCGSEWDSKQTAPVARFAENAFGLYDMQGNVWEWVEDLYHENYQGAPADGRAWLSGDSDTRVLRGGSWFFTIFYPNSSYRITDNPNGSSHNFGFRLVCSHPFADN